MSIVPFSWTQYGTDDILVRSRRKGCRKHFSDTLIPMGAWCSNASTEPQEYAAEATGDTKPTGKTANGGWRQLCQEKSCWVFSYDRKVNTFCFKSELFIARTRTGSNFQLFFSSASGGFAGAAYQSSFGTIFGRSGSARYEGDMICTPYSLKASWMFRWRSA